MDPCVSQQTSVDKLVRIDFHSVTWHRCLSPLYACVLACTCLLLYTCLLMNKHDFVDAEITSAVHAHMLCVCVCVYVCFLKLVSFWLLPNHNSDIVAQPVTHTCTKTCSGKHTHTHAWTCILAFVRSCRHRHTCMHLPTHICLVWKLLLCHITGNEPVHMLPVRFKVRERKRELHCSFTTAPLRLCCLICFINHHFLFIYFFTFLSYATNSCKNTGLSCLQGINVKCF